MVNQQDDIIFLGNELEIIAAVAPSGKMGVEIRTAQATSPQEPAAVKAVRDLLTAFLVDNGYE